MIFVCIKLSIRDRDGNIIKYSLLYKSVSTFRILKIINIKRMIKIIYTIEPAKIAYHFPTGKLYFSR